jgi:anti-sigma factor ChrR (cupin superfamily)
MGFFDFFRRMFRRSGALASHNGKMSPEALRKVLQQIENAQEVELTCDEVLALMDQFAEATLRGEDIARLMPLVQHHLEMCRDCREEFEALLRILQATSS